MIRFLSPPACGEVAGRRSGRGKAETREHRGEISPRMHACNSAISIADYSPNPLCGFLNRADANSSTGSAGNSRSGPLEFPSPSIMIGRMTGRGRMQTGRHGGRGTPSNRASGEAGSRPAIGIRQSLSGYDGYTHSGYPVYRYSRRYDGMRNTVVYPLTEAQTKEPTAAQAHALLYSEV